MKRYSTYLNVGKLIRYYFLPIKLANIKIFNNIQCGQEYGETGCLISWWKGYKLVYKTFKEQLGIMCQILNVHIP